MVSWLWQEESSMKSFEASMSLLDAPSFPLESPFSPKYV